MEKIISLFQRNYDTDKLVRDEVVPGAEWVLNGEGIATKKFDGTCCLISEGKLYKRYDAKHGKVPPAGFMPAQIPDKKTGHWPGWLPVKEEDPQDKYHVEADGNPIFFKKRNGFYIRWKDETYPSNVDKIYPSNIDGTYELCGPKINGNKEGFESHYLVEHGNYPIDEHLYKRTYEGIKEFLKQQNIDNYFEGIVWHHPDGRMVKIKYKDFFK